ncbi:unnamed protein product [Symbiodinium sp. KB8]|nr:unnamed protein product [Symbiodinium sp. KB8]
MGYSDVEGAPDGCAAACFEGDGSSIETSKGYQYVGASMGQYSVSSDMVWVGRGMGDWEKKEAAKKGSSGAVWCVPCLMLAALLIGLGLLWWFLSHRTPVGADDMEPTLNCYEGYHDWKNLWTPEKQAACCDQYGRACPHFHVERDVIHKQVPYPVSSPPHYHYVSVPVPSPSHVVYKTRYIPPAPVEHHFAYNCHAGFSNWYFGWSDHKKGWCCTHQHLGCPGTWHGSYHLSKHVMHGIGHAVGHIYDCEAGYSNWMQGWSDSKKDWCCSHEQKGCVKYHCTGEEVSWHADKSEWCCAHFQKGCPHTTMSPMKCETPCEIHGETDTCKNRIHWTRDHVFGDKENKCSLAYSKVQVECDVCRSCSIQEAGCEVHIGSGSLPFDCNAAINNFFRAWSPEKKHWCCTKQGKGCEGHHPPSVDAGYGMVWKHVQVNGYWTWTAVHGHGHASMPYDCHAGMHNWRTGWSPGKKGWCCSNQQLGCEGGAAAGGGVAGGSVVVHHVVHHGGGFYNHAHPPSAAGSGMMWSWSTAGGGGGHWVQVSSHGHLPFNCLAGVANWQAGWSHPKQVWCCNHFGNSCA